MGLFRKEEEKPLGLGPRQQCVQHRGDGGVLLGEQHISLLCGESSAPPREKQLHCQIERLVLAA